MRLPVNLTAVTTLILMIVCAPYATAGSNYYIYREKDGTLWYSSTKLKDDKFSLLATVGKPRDSRASGSVACSSTTQSLLRREQKHAGTIERYSRKFQIDPNLVKAIIRAESCYDRYAVSRVGAKGLMQLMPQTAMKMGVENIFDAEENIQGGIRYFSQMLSEFENDLRMALAAYNAGPEAVKKYSGIPPYEETIEYVKRVMGYYQQYSAAGLY